MSYPKDKFEPELVKIKSWKVELNFLILSNTSGE